MFLPFEMLWGFLRRRNLWLHFKIVWILERNHPQNYQQGSSKISTIDFQYHDWRDFLRVFAWKMKNLLGISFLAGLIFYMVLLSTNFQPIMIPLHFQSIRSSLCNHAPYYCPLTSLFYSSRCLIFHIWFCTSGVPPHLQANHHPRSETSNQQTHFPLCLKSPHFLLP